MCSNDPDLREHEREQSGRNEGPEDSVEADKDDRDDKEKVKVESEKGYEEGDKQKGIRATGRTDVDDSATEKTGSVSGDARAEGSDHKGTWSHALASTGEILLDDSQI